MCGRYILTTPGEVLAELFELDEKPPIKPRYNIAPTQEVAIVRAGATGGRELAFVQWGLVPHWAKERAIGNRMINARAETLADKPAFRDAYKRRRCLIPADGFFEWQKVVGGKRPWLLRLAGGGPFAFAGLWSRWRDREGGDSLESCAIVTTTPNALLEPIHDRMPVVLPPSAYGAWIDPELQEVEGLTPLLVPFPADTMRAIPVTRWVNDPSHDDPRAIEADPAATREA